MRAWLRGRGKEVPEWVVLLDAAEEWHQPPWVIEEDAPLVWIERWRVMREERAAVPSQKPPKSPKPTGQTIMSDG